MEHITVREPRTRKIQLPYANRAQAGSVLAQLLWSYKARRDTLVLALPRGGVPVAFEVAQTLNAPLDLMIVRKLGYPEHEELAAGAIATGGARVLNPEVADAVDETQLGQIEARERRELERRERLYRGERTSPNLRDRTLILVDDGLATGATMRVAVQAARQQQPSRVIVAVPLASAEAIEQLRRMADDVICPASPKPFFSVGSWYRDFAQVSDRAVRELLEASRQSKQEPGAELLPSRTQRSSSTLEQSVVVHSAGVALEGLLTLPEAAAGMVIFAHGSGSSRFSGRNRHVARILNAAGFSTLLFDLLTTDEESIDSRTRQFRFDIDLLTNRLAGSIDWLKAERRNQESSVGLFGASTGAAAALRAAARHPDLVRAVVSRGGRPDLAGDAIVRVRAPVLLIVGQFDSAVLEMNRAAAAALAGPYDLQVVPNATHLFEEPGALDRVARLTSAWFTRYL